MAKSSPLPLLIAAAGAAYFLVSKKGDEAKASEPDSDDGSPPVEDEPPVEGEPPVEDEPPIEVTLYQSMYDEGLKYPQVVSEADLEMYTSARSKHPVNAWISSLAVRQNEKLEGLYSAIMQGALAPYDQVLGRSVDFSLVHPSIIQEFGDEEVFGDAYESVPRLAGTLSFYTDIPSPKLVVIFLFRSTEDADLSSHPLGEFIDELAAQSAQQGATFSSRIIIIDNPESAVAKTMTFVKETVGNPKTHVTYKPPAVGPIYGQTP